MNKKGKNDIKSKQIKTKNNTKTTTKKDINNTKSMKINDIKKEIENTVNINKEDIKNVNEKVKDLFIINEIKKKNNIKKRKKRTRKIVYVTILIFLLIILFLISIAYNIKLYNKKNEVKIKIEYRNDENIVFYGDSITNKYEIENFFPNNKIINSGKSGDEASDLIERIENDVYKYNPSKVFILIGINDLNHGVKKEDILNNIQNIITGIKIHRKYSKIYIESVYPVNKEYMKEKEHRFNENLTNNDIIEFNKEIEKIAKNNNITYIDVYTSLTDKDGNLNKEYTKEGLHLNDVGYLKVSNVLDKYIKEK